MSKKKKKSPRDIVSEDDFYMTMAFWAATRSRDPSIQSGAIIVGADGQPGSFGFHTLVSKKLEDTEIDWGKQERHDIMTHAEEHAIHRVRWFELEGATMYVTGLPCRHCMNTLVRHGFARIVYYPVSNISGLLAELDDKEKEKILSIAKAGKIKVDEYDGNLNWMRDQIAVFEAWGSLARKKAEIKDDLWEGENTLPITEEDEVPESKANKAPADKAPEYKKRYVAYLQSEINPNSYKIFADSDNLTKLKTLSENKVAALLKKSKDLGVMIRDQSDWFLNYRYNLSQPPKVEQRGKTRHIVEFPKVKEWRTAE